MFEIRPTIITDVEEIINLEKKYLGETLGDMLFSELNNPVAFFLTALSDGLIIGYIGGWIIEDSLEIINLVVDEKYQRMGIGTRLIEELSSIKKIKEVFLDVRITNEKALHFYKKLGFEKINERQSYYKNGDNSYVFKKEL